MGFSRQEYWSGLPCSPPGNLSNPEIKLGSLRSPVKPESFTTSAKVHHVKCQPGRITSWNQIAGRNINNLRYADDTTLMAESEEKLESLMIKVKEESEKAALKLNIQKTKIMASGPIISWQIDSGKVETVADFFFSWAPKSLWTVTAAMKLKDTCSLKEKL